MQTVSLSGVFRALSDPTRLAIVERLLAEGDRTAGEIAEPFAISRPAISKHLKVLSEAGIIDRVVDRQWRVVRLRPEAMRVMDDWVSQYRDFWRGSFQRLDRLFEEAARDRKK